MSDHKSEKGETEKENFVVKDKRRFDSAGNERNNASTNEKSGDAQVKQSPGAAGATTSTGAKEASGGESQINFNAFVMSLATQALMQVGEIKPPPGVEISVDRAAAKQTIDLLALLETKTRGNLDTSESNLLTEVLHNLRMSFVRMV